MKLLPTLCLLLALPTAVSALQDPLKSPACEQALARLDAARAQRAGDVATLRQQAANTCLGGPGTPPARSARTQQAPLSVPPPTIEPPPVAALPPGPSLPPPPVAVQRPPMPAHCDPGGCWTEDGGRLRHVGPNLTGPRGMCSQQGGLVYCP
jgi:hypothetical protein